MDQQLPQGSTSGLTVATPEIYEPITPDPPHATIRASAIANASRTQSARVKSAASQLPPAQRAKTRTPTPTMSQISTPPPTIEAEVHSQGSRALGVMAATMTAEQIADASSDELRTKVLELQAALQEAKMNAAHHRLQYQMLSQESAAAIERMAVEARMAQYENEVIHSAEQAKAAATPVLPSPFQDGMIPVQKDLYQSMCREIQQLTEERNFLADDNTHKDKMIGRQDVDIASLSDKIMLMRDRIRLSRDYVTRYANTGASSNLAATPRSLYSDPLRHGVSNQEQPQPFAALLQASEMASQEARRPKKGNHRQTHSTSSLPATPHRSIKQAPLHQTPQGRQTQLQVPSTAPIPRTSSMRTPDVYDQALLPVPRAHGPPSEGTVSGSDQQDYDSEAETEIIEHDEIGESQASIAASQMLRPTQEQQAKRDSFKGSGMLQRNGDSLKQTRLFGAVRKPNVDRNDERPAKIARTGEPVGLGIAGVGR